MPTSSSITSRSSTTSLIAGSDGQYMARAIRLAERGLYSTMPDPRVGAVIVDGNKIIGAGFHRITGQDHAEIAALHQAGERARGATCYVSLEPCNHQGNTAGPCSEALIAAGISRLVYGHENLGLEVDSGGISRLREAGVQVDGPLMENEARALNPGFNKRMATRLPLVRIKMAVSLDGRTAMPDNNSFWIAGPTARADVQRLRARSCAVVTGWKTVAQNRASMTLRPAEFGLKEDAFDDRQPLRVLLDSHNQLPPKEKFFKAKSPILVANLEGSEREGHIERMQFNDANSRVDLRQLLTELANRHCNEILVEAGAELAGAFFRQGLADELIIYVAPKLMGSAARPMFELPLAIMDESLPVRFSDVRTMGRDIRITAVPETE